MQRLQPPDSHYLNSAVGWLELGNATEARGELNHISAANQSHPDVLEVRWLMAADEGNWIEGLKIADNLVQIAPDRPSGWLHRAYALRRSEHGSVKQAWDALIAAVAKFPKEPTISYNLSCYACQMQQLDAARVWFKRAMSIGGKDNIKGMALKDPDLQPLWSEISSL